MEDGPSDDVFRVGERAGARTRWRGAASLRREADVLAAVSVGGGLGSLARYGVAAVLPTDGGFPWSTFLVNGAGCLLIGVLMVCLTEVWRRPSRLARPFLGIGVLGGLTTYSTMMLDLRTLGSDGDWFVAEVYLGASLVVGLSAVWLGVVATRALARVLPQPRLPRLWREGS